ncbi:MAG: hypothetical protein KBG15_22500 [Kofleriaceae bacterium]|nr:hypothetical protein [Kofleriaceae bacterium]
MFRFIHWAMRLSAVLLVVACERPVPPRAAVALDPAVLPALYGRSDGGRSPGTQPLWPYTSVPVRAKLGRGVAPLAAAEVPVFARPTITTPLELPTVWQLPSARPLAAVAGQANGSAHIELIDIDAGEVLWRDSTTCAAPIVAVTSGLVICGDGNGLRALDLQGGLRWTHPGQWVATSGAYLIVARPERIEVINAESGALERELKMPASVSAAMLRGVCQHANGLDIVVVDGATVTRFIAPPDPAGAITPTWTASLAATAVDFSDAAGGCRDEWIVQGATEPGDVLFSLSRLTGAAIARIPDVTGLVRRRDDSLLVSTTRNVINVNRRLLPLATDVATATRLSELPPFGRMVATFGDAALVQTSAHTAMFLDGALRVVWFELSGQSAAIGKQYVLAGNRLGRADQSLHRYQVPVPSRDRAPSPRPTRRAPPGYVAAELRDLPAAVPLPVDRAITAAGEAMHSVGAALIDPAQSAHVYVVTMAQAPTAQSHAGVSLLDLGSNQWRWHAHDACGPGAPLAIAKSENTFLCASQDTGPQGATVTATDASGVVRWQWHGATIDAVSAQGRVVMLHRGHLVTILDETTGEPRGDLPLQPSTPAQAVLVAASSGAPWLVAVHGTRLVVHTTAVGLVPLWAVHVSGVVETLQAFGSTVIVGLEDGDSYLVDIPTATVRAIPSVHDRLMVLGDLLSSERSTGNGVWQQALLRSDASMLTRNDYAMAVTLPRSAVAPPKRRWPPVAAPTSLPPRVFHYPAAANYVRGSGNSELLLMFSTTHVAVVAPLTGTPRLLVTLPPDATGVGFATEVDGQPRSGVLLHDPLRAVLF